MVLESSKEAATNARELSEKSEAAREDPGMIAALLGCGILYKFGLKLMPQEKRDQFKAWKKKKRKEFEKWKKNNKTKVQMWQTVGLLAGGLFTYSDLATDILAIQSLYSSGEDGWALAMVCTLIFPSILAMGGILKYVYDNHIEYFRCGNWYYIFALPFFHAGLDLTMPSLMIIDLVFKTNWGKRKARGWKVRNTELNTILGDYDGFSVELIDLGWEKIRQMNVDLNKGGKFPWGTTILKEISLLLRTNDLRLPKFLDHSSSVWSLGPLSRRSAGRF